MTTPAGRLLTQRHYATQVGLKAAMVRDAQKLWRLWTPGDRRSWNAMVETAFAVIAARHAVSTADAARYFETLSVIETGRREIAEFAAPLAREHVERSLASTGLVGTVAARSRGLPMEAAAQVGFTRFAGAASRLALDGARMTVVNSSMRSDRVSGYNRVTGASPCAFCAGIAADGADSSGDFQAHDHCSCTAEPVFAGS